MDFEQNVTAKGRAALKRKRKIINNQAERSLDPWARFAAGWRRAYRVEGAVYAQRKERQRNGRDWGHKMRRMSPRRARDIVAGAEKIRGTVQALFIDKNRLEKAKEAIS